MLSRHIDLLNRVQSMETQPPPDVLTALRDRLKELVQAGPWKYPLQLPALYVPGLAARPVHTLADFPELQPVVMVLQDAAHDLAEELQRLEDSQLLMQDKECVASATGGSWHRYSVNGVWHRRNDDGCSMETPQACHVLKYLKDRKLADVIRADFSVVAVRVGGAMCCALRRSCPLYVTDRPFLSRSHTHGSGRTLASPTPN